MAFHGIPWHSMAFHGMSSGRLPEQHRSGVSDADAAGAILEAAARPIQPKPRPTNQSLQEINIEPAMSDLENHCLTDFC